MARQKQSNPIQRVVSSEYTSKAAGSPRSLGREQRAANTELVRASDIKAKNEAGLLQLIVAVLGIYASFLTWAVLQERLTTTPHGDDPLDTQVFSFPFFLNTIQSIFAASVGYLYLLFSTPRGGTVPAIIPTPMILLPLLLVSLTNSLASPFGYASLAHIDYVTFILAKSCKLLPVMFLHITLFRRSFPIYKYLVVCAVTVGVAIFTLHATSAKAHKVNEPKVERNAWWGLLLLGVNLLFDGLTNTTQDFIFTKFKPYTGPQMMCANNILGTVITVSWLFFSPYLAHTGIGEYLGIDLTGGSSGDEFKAALAFMAKYPAVWWDVLGFAACGAVGQVFIFYTLSHFSSVLLVTVTVTRKMFTMILSVLWFGHRLSGMQWVGVGLVFGGVGAEGVIQRREKSIKEALKLKHEKAEVGKKADGMKKEL